MSQSNKRSPEWIAANKARNIKRWKDNPELHKEQSDRMKEYYKEHPQSEETNCKRSETMKKQCSTPDVRKQMSARAKKWVKEHPEEAKARAKNRKGRKNSEAAKKMQSESNIRYRLEHPEEATEWMKKSRKSCTRQNTKPERTVADLLQKMRLDYHDQWFVPSVNARIGQYHAFDFALLGYKILIEVDGDYWHNLKEVRTKDVAINKAVESTDWILIRVWEHDVINNPAVVAMRIAQACLRRLAA